MLLLIAAITSAPLTVSAEQLDPLPRTEPPPGDGSSGPWAEQSPVDSRDPPENPFDESREDLVDLEGRVFDEPEGASDVVPDLFEPESRAHHPLVIVEHPTAAPQQVEPPAPTRPGTHAVVELNAGAALGGEPGVAGGALVGIGGKPVGFPWRFYFIGEVGQTHFRDVGLIDTGSYEAGRRYWNVAAGLRIYIPIHDPVRFFADATLGGAYVSSTLIRDDLAPLTADDWYISGAVAVGLQVRVLHELSIGLRARLLLADDALSDLRDTLEITDGVPVIVTAGLTWHI